MDVATINWSVCALNSSNAPYVQLGISMAGHYRKITKKGLQGGPYVLDHPVELL